MPGPAPKPPDQRVTRHKPQRGEWQAAPGTGWQHGKPPPPPKGIGRAAKAAWNEWFAAWVASFWRPEDVHAIRTMALLYDQMLEKPSATTAAQLGQYFDRFGLTPKGLQDRRWQPPENDTQQEKTPAAESKYRRLRVVNE
jgi:hypothetical protein